MNKVICIGSSTQDIFFPTSEGKIIETPEELISQRKIAFELGAKYKIDRRFESLGGCSANVAAGLSRQNLEVAHYTVVGKDAIGEWIKKIHLEENIGINLVETCDCKSDLTMVLVNEDGGERVIFHHKEANEKFEFDPDKLTKADWVYIGDIFGDWKGIVEGIAEKAAKENMLIAFNPRETMISDSGKKIFDFFRSCEIVFLNKDEAIEILLAHNGKIDSQDEKYLMAELKKSGARVIVITDGERGAWAINEDNDVHVDAVKVDKAIDMTGAGDAFASGFLAAYIKRKDLEECVHWGVKNGASVVKHFGGIKGLLRENEM